MLYQNTRTPFELMICEFPASLLILKFHPNAQWLHDCWRVCEFNDNNITTLSVDAIVLFADLLNLITTDDSNYIMLTKCGMDDKNFQFMFYGFS